MVATRLMLLCSGGELLHADYHRVSVQQCATVLFCAEPQVIATMDVKVRPFVCEPNYGQMASAWGVVLECKTWPLRIGAFSFCGDR